MTVTQRIGPTLTATIPVYDDVNNWIVSAAGKVYECSTLGDPMSFESAGSFSGYYDDLCATEITDPERLADVADKLRMIAGLLDKLGEQP